jgi:hypothetical protein
MQPMHVVKSTAFHARLLSIGLILGLAAGRSYAQSVTLLSESRWVSASGFAPNPPALSPNQMISNAPLTAFSEFHGNANAAIGWLATNGWQAPPTSSSAGQDSSLSPVQFNLSSHLFVQAGGDPYGTHFAPGLAGTAQAGSYFEVSFSVPSRLAYDFLYEFDVTPTLQTADCTLSSLNHGSVQLFRTFGTPLSGSLEPDTYTLRCEFRSLAAGDQAGSAFNSLTIEFVPEPSSGSLLAAALLGFVAYRWKFASRNNTTARPLAPK